MAWNRMDVIDGDGHVMEDWDALLEYMPAAYHDRFRGKGRLFPPLDHLHSATLYDLVPGAFRQVGPPGWLEFMDDVGIERAVLYPTGGLAVGKVINGDFAIEICQAYNNWFHDTYLKTSAKFQGLGLIPMQEPPEAVKELRRIVEELGFCGAMLPSMGLKGHLGSKEYWPVYAEAHRLGCSIAVHGGAHEGLGMDYLTPYAPINGLGHPFGQMVCFAGFVFNGLFDRYPNMRVGFMEGGVAWIHTCLERFDRGWETHVQYDPRGEFIQLEPGEQVSGYIRRHAAEGRIFIGCEGTEPTLHNAIEALGNKPFMFSSDFPHEVNNDYCKAEIREIVENDRLTDDDKHGVLHRNAEEFYGLAIEGERRAAL
jgi:predicted TIM-barrel fold metal-dependent hydrolase